MGLKSRLFRPLVVNGGANAGRNSGNWRMRRAWPQSFKGLLWEWTKCHGPADAGGIACMRRIVNGGTVGLAEVVAVLLFPTNKHGLLKHSWQRPGRTAVAEAAHDIFAALRKELEARAPGPFDA